MTTNRLIAQHDCGICDAPLVYVGDAGELGDEWHCTGGCAEEGNAHFSVDCCERPAINKCNDKPDSKDNK